MSDKMISALLSVNWLGNVEGFATHAAVVEKLDGSCKRIAVWAKQLENVDGKNPAISFVRALQISAQQAVATASLGIYKAAASSIRGLVENALYYTYFRSHLVELSSLVRNKAYYTSKSEILAFHKVHTAKFRERQETIGLVSRIEDWYSDISSIVHGQIPGIWVNQSSLGDIKTDGATLSLVANEFCRGEQIVHELLLLTVGSELWDGFSHPSKKMLLANLPGHLKNVLGLDKQ